MNVKHSRWSLLQQAMEKHDADEKPDEGGTEGEDKSNARQVSRGSRAGAKATTKGNNCNNTKNDRGGMGWGGDAIGWRTSRSLSSW